MRDQTRQLVRELRTFPLLENCGSATAAQYGIRISSWERALDEAIDRNWENLCKSCSNRINQRCVLAKISNERAWNSVVGEINDILVPVCDRVDRYFSSINAPWSIAGHVIFQLRSAVEETEYSDVTPPFFFLPVLLPVYRAGLFACGWDGAPLAEVQLDGSLDRLPSGRLKVY
jgi:hypothetical protein